MLEILEEVSDKMGKQIESAWLLNGQRMMSPLDLPIQTRVLVASTTENFKGISGLEHFDLTRYASISKENRTNVGGATFVNTVTMPSIKVKPQPQTWVQMAQAKWCKNNTTTNIPSYNEQQANEQEA